MGGWRASKISDSAWRPPLGQSRADAQAEQDHAAGGRHARRLETISGVHAHGRVKLRVRRGTRRGYAYLTWNQDGRRHELLLDEVTEPQRGQNLRAAWDLIHQHHLLTPEGRQAWPKSVSPAE